MRRTPPFVKLPTDGKTPLFFFSSLWTASACAFACILRSSASIIASASAETRFRDVTTVVDVCIIFLKLCVIDDDDDDDIVLILPRKNTTGSPFATQYYSCCCCCCVCALYNALRVSSSSSIKGIIILERERERERENASQKEEEGRRRGSQLVCKP